MPSEFAINFGDVANDYPWNLRIVNPAKSSNAIKEARCFIDSTRQPFSTDPVDLLMKPIEGYQAIGGWLTLPAHKVMGEYERVGFEFVPIRGRCRRFKFSKPDLLHPF